MSEHSEKEDTGDNEEISTESLALDYSDEDIAKMDYTEFEQAVNAGNNSEESEDSSEDDLDQDSEEESTEDASEEEESAETEEEISSQDVFENSESTQEDEENEEDEEPAEEPEKSEPSDDIDFKNEYLKLLTPFKANGREMKVDNVEDARRLMQMGVNYNKKMASLKPNLRIMKTLENNDLLNEEKINFLIDLDKKNPDAVAKFLKDSEIDPLDLDLDNDSAYKPSTYTVDEKEFEIDEVLDSIRDTESFNRTIDEVSNKWDQKSKQVILDNPNLLRVINEHIGTGMYDQIMGVVENERILGRLDGLSDLDAYKTIGDMIHEKGGFTSKSEPKAKIQNKPQDLRLKNRKKAASSTKGSKSNQNSDDFNPLSLSDEEFEKVAGSRFL